MTFWVKSIYAILICQEISQDHGSPKKKKILWVEGTVTKGICLIIKLVKCYSLLKK
jgi:hypothetical protein